MGTMKGRLTFQELPKHCRSEILRAGNSVSRAWSNLLGSAQMTMQGARPLGEYNWHVHCPSMRKESDLSESGDLEPTAVPRINPLISGFWEGNKRVPESGNGWREHFRGLKKCGYLSMTWKYFSIWITDMAIATHMVGYLLYSKFKPAENWFCNMEVTGLLVIQWGYEFVWIGTGKMQGKLVTLSRGFAIKRSKEMGLEMRRSKEAFLDWNVHTAIF